MWLLIFNLLPAFPMDGGRVLRAALTPWLGRLRATRWASRLGRLAAAGFGGWAVFGGTHTDWMLLVIAIFLYLVAGQEYRSVQADELRRAQQWNNPWTPGAEPPDSVARVVVSPPPYAHGGREELPLRVLGYRKKCTTENSSSQFCSKCGASLPTEAKLCSLCGEQASASPPATHPPTSDAPSESPLRKELFRSWIGGLMIIGGLIAAAYFFFFFDTSVEVPTQQLFGQTIGGYRVNNLGLMAQRQNGIIFSFGAAIVGAVIEFFARSRK